MGAPMSQSVGGQVQILHLQQIHQRLVQFFGGFVVGGPRWWLGCVVGVVLGTVVEVDPPPDAGTVVVVDPVLEGGGGGGAT
jgi:hypothetical protein